MVDGAEKVGGIGELIGKGIEGGDMPLLPESIKRNLKENAEDIILGAENFGGSVSEDMRNRVEDGDGILEGMFEELGGVDDEIKGEKEKFNKSLEGEVVYHQGEWLDEEISDEKKEWLKDNGYEDIAEEFTQEEKEQVHKFYEDYKDKYEKDSDFKKVIDEVFDGEGDAVEEAIDATKLLIRIAVKAGIGLARSIAKNLSKNPEASKEVRLMMGVFADGLGELEGFADKLIAGDAGASLEADIIAFITDKYN